MPSWYLPLLSFALVAALGAFGEGAWVKDESAPFGSLIVKAGTFGRHGTFTPVALGCHDGKRWAWVGHRLAAGETMDERAGARLGKALSMSFKAPCFSGVELDLEPLPSAPEWLVPFLRAIRVNLDPGLGLSLAVYPGWPDRQIDEALSAIDRLDVMLYDTGLTDEKAYLELIRKTARAFRSRPRKVLLGFPSYPKTKRHHPKVESLAVVEKVMPELCELEWAVYAGWTLTGAERASFDRMVATCRERRPPLSPSPLLSPRRG